MKIIKLRLMPVAMLALVVFSFGINILSPLAPKAMAAYDWQAITTKTKKYSTLSAFIACINNHSSNIDTYPQILHATDNISQLMKSIDEVTANNSRTLVATGFVLDDGYDHDGKSLCNGEAVIGANTQNYLGYGSDFVGFMGVLGFVKDVTGNQYIFTDGNKDPKTKVAQASSKLIDRVKSLASSQAIPLSATPPMQYILLTTALKYGSGKGCAATIRPFSDIQKEGTDGQYPTSDGKHLKIKMVADDGTAQDYGVDLTDPGRSSVVFPDQNGETASLRCGDIALQIDSITPSVATAIAGETVIKNASAEEKARIAAASVYAASICKNISGPIGSETYQEQCASAVLKCLQPQVKDLKINGKVVETVTINATPEEIDPNTFTQCVVDAKVTNLSKGEILKIVNKLKDTADKAAAAARADELQTQCQQDPNADGCTDAQTTDGCPMGQDTFMRWMGCGLITLTSSTINFLYDSIKGLLYTPVDEIFNQSFQAVVGKFRIIGMALVLITGLIMVIAQASGSDLVDAYTVRKVLPRLAFAIIGMALAWPLLRFAIGLTNDLGLLAGSFVGNLGSGSLGGSEANIAGGFVNFAVGLPITAFVTAMKFGWTGFSLLGTAGLALLLGLLVLAIRQLVIIVLVILAPLAIAASVLPGTDKLWKFWKNTLITTLAMFPIIMLFLKSGELFSRIAGNMKGEYATNEAWAIIAIIAYFAPYFMLPFAFKMAGGLMSNIFGIVNDRGKGLFDRMRNAREEAWKQRKGRASGNSLWDSNNALVRRLKLNQAASFLTSPGSNIAYYGRKKIPFLSRYGESVASSVHSKTVQHSTKLAQKLAQDHAYNDRAFRVLSGAHEKLSTGVKEELTKKGLYGKRIQTVEQLRTVADILSRSEGDGSDGVGERNASNAILSSIGTIAAAYQDPEMMKADVAAAGIIGLASAGYANGDDVTANANIIAGDDKSGKELAQSVMATAINAGSRGHPGLRAGYGPVWDSRKGEFVNAMDADRAKEIALKLGMHDIADAKPDAFTELIPGINANLSGEGEKGKYRQKEQIDKLLSWAGPYSSAKGDFKAEVLKFIDESDNTALKEAYAQYKGLPPEVTEGGQNQGPQDDPSKKPPEPGH